MQEPHQLRFLHELVESLNNQIRGSEVSIYLSMLPLSTYSQ